MEASFLTQIMLPATLAVIMAGLTFGALFRLAARDSVTLCIEVGIQNAWMAILIAALRSRPEPGQAG